MGTATLRRRSLAALIALTRAGTVLAAGWAAFARLLPQHLESTNRLYNGLAVIGFFGQVFTFHFGLALTVATAVAAVARRWRLTLVAGVAAAACLAPAAYDLRPRHPAPIAGPSLRVMAANLFVDSHDYAGILAGVRANDPDVVAFEEYTFDHDANVRPALAAAYPYRCVEPRRNPSGLAVYSKRPFAEPPRPQVTKDRSQIRVVVTVGDRRVAVYAVHPAAPVGRWGVYLNRAQVADLARQLATEPYPAVLAGDWNFTPDTANAAALRAAGLSDAHALAGRSRDTTWPAGPHAPFAPWVARLPGFRIDTVYLTSQLTCARSVVGGYDGSDHLPVIADVGFAKPATVK